MALYKFDWTATISGTIEIDAQNGLEADEIFNFYADRELVQRSEILPDKYSRIVRFVTAGQVEVYTAEEWDNFWKDHC